MSRSTKSHWIQLIRRHRQTNPVILPDEARPRLHELPGIRAVVFDVYGTLFSSGVGDISLAAEQNRDAALRATLLENGFRIKEAARGVRLDELLHDMIYQHQDARRKAGIIYPEVDIRKVWEDFLSKLERIKLIAVNECPSVETLVIDYESRVNPTQTMPGLDRTLDALKERGVVLSIISNAQFYTPLLFETHLHANLETLGFCEKCTVWSYALLEGKPSTRLYEVAAQKLTEHHSIRPASVLYVGNDMRNDIWPAQETGFKTALFAGDRLSLRRREDDPDCRGRVPDVELTELEQLLKII